MNIRYILYIKNKDPKWKIKLCRTCEDYGLCCDIGRCGNYSTKCYRKHII